jgi:cytochrome c biogenesis protein CcmG, thiol:disulfide interchange protein DsbE
MKLSRNPYVIVLLVFVALLAVLLVGLKLNPRDVPSPLLSKPAPLFTLPVVGKNDAKNGKNGSMAGGKAAQQFSPQDLRGQVWLLNVWASWCVSCRYEHPVLIEFAKTAQVPLIGLNYKELLNDDEAGKLLQSKASTAADTKARAELTQRAQSRAQAWLAQHGDPYTLSVLDLDGRVGIDYGVYGVPETYVIDKAGVIRLKFTGPLDAHSLQRDIVPLIKRLQS